MRRLNAEQAIELQRLQSGSLALLAWLEQHDGFRYAPPLRAIIDEACTRQQLGKMRALAKELRGMIGSLPPPLRQQIIDGIGASGIPLAADLEIDTDAARAIVARGRLASDEEYYALRHYLDRLEAEASFPEDERRAVLAMLENYDGGSAPTAT